MSSTGGLVLRSRLRIMPDRADIDERLFSLRVGTLSAFHYTRALPE